MNNTRIQLISGPRNISTALMYSFGNRKSCHIIDEPLYAYYLQLTGADHPGKEEIIRSQSTDPEEVIHDLTKDNYKKEEVFIKNMAHHFIGLNPIFSLDFKNIFLIRNTTEILTSFSKVIPNPTIADIGIKKEWELYNYLIEKGDNPVVLDSGILLENPKIILQKLCKLLDLNFQRSMLSWNPGSRKEDGVWAKHWYKNVHKSTHFKNQQSTPRILRENLKHVNEEAYIYYEKLLDKAIKA